MIIVRTGLPGAGKTLNTIYDLTTDPQWQGRDLYVSGIPDLQVPHIPLDEPEKWYDCPSGAVIVIDEAQRVFPPRANGSIVPEKVKRLETHRHQGVDIILITQDASLIDNAVRRLAGQHIHCVRAGGFAMASLYTWPEVQWQINEMTKKTAQVVKRRYPKEVFKLYKSAEIHTVKRRIPFGLMFFFALLIGLPIMIAVAYFRIMAIGSATSIADAPGERVSGSVGRSLPVSGYSKDPALSEYLGVHRELVPGLPWSSQFYQEVFRPVTYPKPHCMIMGAQCRCYSQQSTRMDVALHYCVHYATAGFFDPTRADDVPIEATHGERRGGAVGGREAPNAPHAVPAPIPQEPALPPAVPGVQSMMGDGWLVTR